MSYFQKMFRENTSRRWRQYKEDKICFRYLKDRTNILDVGCGKGRFLDFFTKDQILGIDNDSHSVQICRDKGLKARKMDALDIKLENKYDAIHCSHLIEHFYPEQLYCFLNKINELLKPGGLLIIRTPLLCSGFYNDLTHVRPYNPSVIISYLAGNDYQQKTKKTISSDYRVVKIIYRYLPLLLVKHPTTKVKNIMRLFFDFLAFIHIHSFKKDAYIIVLKK